MSYWNTRKVVVTGASGFLGTHLTRRLIEEDARVFMVKHEKSDLRKSDAANRMMDFAARREQPPPVIFHLAARVSGIGAISRQPATALHDNLLMGLNVLQAASDNLFEGKVVLAGSVCAYPKYAPQPMVEENLWEGYPEESNGPYGVAKRTLAVAVQTYRQQYGLDAVYPLLANLYGPGDNIDPQTSHVIPALFRKFLEAKINHLEEVTVWGSGTASRDFLYVEDAVDALVTCAERLDISTPINIGTGRETPIAGIVELISSIVGFTGHVVYDRSKPDGQPRRCLQTRAAKKTLNWEATTSLEEGLRKTYEWIEPLMWRTLSEEKAKRDDEDAQLKRFGFRV